VMGEDNGSWTQQMVRFMVDEAPRHWSVRVHTVPGPLPVVVDDVDSFLPQNGLPDADLLVMLPESPGLVQLTPEIASMAAADDVIMPVDSEEWLPRGLQNQLTKRLSDRGIEAVYPSPFCALTQHHGYSEAIGEFTGFFGRPELAISCDNGVIQEIDVARSAPCGNTYYVADKLVGRDAGSAEEEGPLLHHYYPCLATPSLIHRSALITQTAIRRALRSRC